MDLSHSLDNLSNLRAQPMYSTKNCVNGAEIHSLSRRLRFGPANQISPYDCSIPCSETNIPFFHDPIALTQATENPNLQTLDYDALSYVIRHSCHLLCSRVNGSAAQLVPFTRANGWSSKRFRTYTKHREDFGAPEPEDNKCNDQGDQIFPIGAERDSRDFFVRWGGPPSRQSTRQAL